MYIVVKILANYLSVSILNTIIEILVGAIVYLGMLVLLKYQFAKDIFTQIIKGKGVKQYE